MAQVVTLLQEENRTGRNEVGENDNSTRTSFSAWVYDVNSVSQNTEKYSIEVQNYKEDREKKNVKV